MNQEVYAWSLQLLRANIKAMLCAESKDSVDFIYDMIKTDLADVYNAKLKELNNGQ